MCVICYKPKGICTPTKSYRGLSFNAFYKAIKKVDSDEPCVIHFRLATHGSVKRANCHPFYDKETNTYFAHNGILNIQADRDKTDSETAFRHIFVHYILKYGLKSAETFNAVMQVRANTGSKFIFMQGYEVKMFGNFQPFEGCYVSNKRFLAYHGESSYLTRKGKYSSIAY